MSYDQNDPFAKPGDQGQPAQPNQPPAYGQGQPPAYGQGQPPAYGQGQPPAYGQGGTPASPQYPGGPSYGQPGQPYAPIGENPGKTMGIVGFIFSLFACIPVLPPLGIILSAIGFSKSRKAGYSNGLGLAGIIIGAVVTVLMILWIILFGVTLLNIYSTCQDLGPGTHYVDGVTYTCS